jgi:hypothetical protein
LCLIIGPWWATPDVEYCYVMCSSMGAMVAFPLKRIWWPFFNPPFLVFEVSEVSFTTKARSTYSIMAYISSAVLAPVSGQKLSQTKPEKAGPKPGYQSEASLQLGSMMPKARASA